VITRNSFIPSGRGRRDGEMAKKATQKRYCAIADGICDEIGEIDFAGSRSCFLAYPFAPHYIDFMTHLQEELARSLNIRATLPTDVVAGRILFCKLCKEIYRTNFTISEVTDLNRNVLFEHGYALGARRHGLLLRNRSVRLSEFPLLGDVDQLLYGNRGDILSEMHKYDPDKNDPRKRPLRLIGMCRNCQIDEVIDRLYFLKSGSRSDVMRMIGRLLRRSPFRVVDDDPNDIAGHQIHQYCRRVQEARHIVGHFVSDRAIDHERINARVAFLMGLAVGFGKRVLILQESPVEKKMIDLLGLIREYETESQAKEIVENWLERKGKELRRLKVQTKPRRKKRILDIRELTDLGDVAAEKDFDLGKYFVKTMHYRRAERGEKTLFIGRKGSGKTANFVRLAEESQSPNDVVIEINPRDFELLKLGGFLTQEFSRLNWSFVYRYVWRNILITEIIQGIYEQHPSYVPYSKTLTKLFEFRSENSDLFELPFVERLVYLVRKLEQLHSTGRDFDDMQQVEGVVRQLKLRDIEETLKAVLREKRVHVLIDGLDKDWAMRNEDISFLLVALIEQADSLNTYFAPNLHIVVFLRTDIFDIVKRKDLEIDKKPIEVISWEPYLLEQVIGERVKVRLGASEMSTEQAWASLFPRSVNKQKTSQYILERTLLRPRDAITFCQRCLEEAQNRGHKKIRAQDVLRAEERYSDDQLFLLWHEYDINYPDLGELLLRFQDAPLEIQKQDFAEMVKNVQESGSEKIRPWIREYSTDDVLKLLYTIGFLGVKDKDGHILYERERPYGNGLPRERRGQVYIVHPAFRKVLKIREG
jgi:hypothetical protein